MDYLLQGESGIVVIYSTGLVSIYSATSDVHVRGHFRLKEELQDYSLKAEASMAGSISNYF